MSRYRIPLSHSARCICQRCSAARQKARREAERPRRLPAEHFSAELVRLRADGATFRGLAEATGLAVGTVHRILHGGVTVDSATQELLADMAERGWVRELRR